jgi:hypothetical protein
MEPDVVLSKCRGCAFKFGGKFLKKYEDKENKKAKIQTFKSTKKLNFFFKHTSSVGVVWDRKGEPQDT